eukprot:scaffold44057_cov59-Attheya_sp.AAC.4
MFYLMCTVRGVQTILFSLWSDVGIAQFVICRLEADVGYPVSFRVATDADVLFQDNQAAPDAAVPNNSHVITENYPYTRCCTPAEKAIISHNDGVDNPDNDSQNSSNNIENTENQWSFTESPCLKKPNDQNSSNDIEDDKTYVLLSQDDSSNSSDSPSPSTPEAESENKKRERKHLRSQAAPDAAAVPNLTSRPALLRLRAKEASDTAAAVKKDEEERGVLVIKKRNKKDLSDQHQKHQEERGRRTNETCPPWRQIMDPSMCSAAPYQVNKDDDSSSSDYSDKSSNSSGNHSEWEES